MRSDRLGDTLLSTPLLATLNEAFPQARITVLASPIGAQALAGNPRIHEVIAVDLHEAGLVAKIRLARRLRCAGFDITLCLSEKFWPRMITWLANSRIRAGFDPGSTQPLVSLLCRVQLSHRAVWRQEPHSPDPPHEVERYASLLTPLGIASGTGRLEMYLSSEDLLWAAGWLADRVPTAAIPVVVNLNGKWLRDGWTLEQLGSMFATLLTTIPEVVLILTTDRNDGYLLDGLQALRTSDRVHAVTGETLGRWSALIASSRALITMDTGAVHISAALGTPVVDIFPSEGFEHCSRRWAPWQVAHKILRLDSPDRDSAFTLVEHLSCAIRCARNQEAQHRWCGSEDPDRRLEGHSGDPPDAWRT